MCRGAQAAALPVLMPNSSEAMRARLCLGVTGADTCAAVNNEHFVDAAYKYVLHLDPKLKGQIPLANVYQFFNLVGAPLGNYGTDKVILALS